MIFFSSKNLYNENGEKFGQNFTKKLQMLFECINSIFIFGREMKKMRIEKIHQARVRE